MILKYIPINLLEGGEATVKIGKLFIYLLIALLVIPINPIQISAAESKSSSVTDGNINDEVGNESNPHDSNKDYDSNNDVNMKDDYPNNPGSEGENVADEESESTDETTDENIHESDTNPTEEDKDTPDSEEQVHPENSKEKSQQIQKNNVSKSTNFQEGDTNDKIKEIKRML